MKKALTAFCFVVFVICFTLSVSAKNIFTMSLSSDEVKNNRLFSIDVYADGDNNLCGGELLLSFDNTLIEYRGVKSDVFEVKANDNDGVVDIVFASAEAQNMSPDTVLLSVEFKSINSGTFEMSLDSKECVNGSLGKLDISSFLCNVTIDGDKVTTKTIKSKSTSPKTTVKSEKSKVIDVEDESTESDTYGSMKLSEGTDSSKAIFYGVCAGVAVVVVFILGVLFAKNQDVNSESK